MKTVTDDSSPAEHGHHPSRVLVRFQPGARADLLPDSGKSVDFSEIENLHLVENPPGLSVADAVRNYKANPNVLYAEPDFNVSTTSDPTDPMWGQQWDMQKISAPAGWSVNTSANDVIVAVIDTGVDFTHPDLSANLWINPADGSHGYTCMNGTCAAGGQDDYGHGTHVAGTIGAVADNGVGIAGINWRTQILSCKFLGSNGNGNVSDAILCFNQILQLKKQGFNIRVTNNSWGGDGYSQSLKDAMAAVESAGIVNVCAAGNNGVNADLSPMYPGAYDNRGIISVLASDQSDLAAYFSNFGIGNVDIAAPGVSTLSTVPTGSCPLCDPSGYKLLSGTSMATPHVSGVVAALFHQNPGLSAYEARDVLLDPASYDALTDPMASLTSTGGRLNLAKALTNPLLSAPKLNNFPILTSVPDIWANAGDTVNLTAAASDPDGDPVRLAWSSPGFSVNSQWLLGWMLSQSIPAVTGSSVSFQAPSLAIPAVEPFAVAAADGRGGSASATLNMTVSPSPNPGGAPSGALSVSPVSGPVGTTVAIDFPATDPEGGPVAWDLWRWGLKSGAGLCCQTGTFSYPMNQAGVYRIDVQAIDSEMNLSDRQTAVVRIGGATGTPPLVNASFDNLTGTAPLTVNIDMSGSTDPDGTIQNYTIVCNYATGGIAVSGPKGSCLYDTPGTYWMMLTVKDNAGLMDGMSAYVVVLPAGSAPPTKTTATVALSNMTQAYTGSALMPTATTNPPGLAIVWTNAPQTQPGTYSVTATVSDPNYQGSASGTFTVSSVKTNASVVLGNLTQTYTGSALTPSATTNPPGLPIIWTNAPQTNAGTYQVTATISDPSYQGSASGTFVINKAKASVTLSNLTQTYTGTPLAPAGATTPLGLNLAWTNAPQTDTGSYPVTATVNDPNYAGSTSGMFTIAPSVPSTPPSVVITSPASGNIKAGTVTIQASVTPGTNPVSRVDFLINGAVKCSDTAAPYTCSWKMPGAIGKAYQLQANAYDSTGLMGSSSVVNVTSSK